MKKTVLLFIIGFYFNVFSQNNSVSFTNKTQNALYLDSLKGFDYEELQHHLVHFKGTEQEKNIRIERTKRAFIDRKYKLGAYGPPKINANRSSGNQSTDAVSCTNIGFEAGNTSGWTVTGDNAITSGTGTDPFGNFPQVFAGNYSLQLSSNNTGTSNFTSSATRVISVSSTGSTFFKLNFALDILDYPHPQNAAAKFTVNFFDASNNQLPCPQYQCYYYQNSANVGTAVGVSSFQNTSCPGNCGVNLGGQQFQVTYATWQTISMDLSAYSGQNITCKIECDWCIYNYDWAYCYIDADCPTANVSPVASCGSLPFNLSGPTGMDTYSWTPPPGNSPATSNTYSINASVAGTYTLNCTLNTCSVSAYTYTYNVQPGPTPNFTNTTAACSGNLTFTNTSTANSGPPITGYTWHWGDGTANGTTANATHTFTNVGTNTVTLVITNGTCIDSISKTVVIPPHPIAGFNLINNCLNAVSNFTSTSTAGAGIASQGWSFGDATTGTGAAPSHTYTLAGTYQVKLVVTDNNSCKDSITKPITINSLPIITVNSSTICVGQQTATLTAMGASTYTWNPTTNLTPTSGSPVSGNPTATTNYTVTGTDANGCVNTATTTITVNSLPIITVNSSTICVGQQMATLTAMGASIYTWNPTTNLTPTSGSPVSGNPTVTTNYTVTGTDINGCVNTATSTITVNALPIVTVNSATICAGQQTATLTATGASTYSWNPTTNLTPTSGSPVVGTPTTTTHYTVIGADANRCTNTATATITVNALPPVTASSSTVCVGQQTATLTANGANSYTWTPSATLSSNTGTPVVGTTTVTTNYTVTGTDAKGCTNTATSTITVNTLPPLAVNSATICIGQQTATLTANGAVNYVWNPSATLSQPTGNIVTGTPAVTTHYTVTGTDANGCVNTATTSIMVNALPLPTATSNTPCASQQTLILNCPLNNMASYTWAGPNVFASSVQSPTIAIGNVTNAAAGTYTVYVTDNNTCKNTATVNVVVNPLPILTVNSPTVCQNQTINLTANGGASYSWVGPLAYASSSQNPTINNASLNMAGGYTVVTTDANLCISGNLAHVTVNPLPVIYVNSDTICLGQQTATLTASGATSYTWNPSNNLSSNIGFSVTATPNATTNYTVTATDNNSCVNDKNTVVVVRSLPIITTSSITPACVPMCTTLMVTSNPAASNYVWNFGNGHAPASTALNPASSSFMTPTCFTVAGTFVVNLTVTDINSCVSTATTIAVAYPVPIADFEFGPQPISIVEPRVQFANQSSGTISNYNWNFGDTFSNGSDISNVISPSYTYLNIGTYSVTLLVTSPQGCTSKVMKPLVVNETYVIYVPNAFSPNGDGTNDVFKAAGEGINTFKLYIFDRWGNILFYSDDINKGWDGTFQGKGSQQILQEDVYVWKIDLTDFTNKNQSLHGTVTLIK